jgi:hypothetical protein
VGIIRHCISKEDDKIMTQDLDAYKRPTTPRTMFTEALLFDTMSVENIITLRTYYQDLLGIELPSTDTILKTSSNKNFHALNEHTMYPQVFVASSGTGSRINWLGKTPSAMAEWNHDENKKLKLIMKFRSLVAQFFRGSFSGRAGFSLDLWKKDLNDYKQILRELGQLMLLSSKLLNQMAP